MTVLFDTKISTLATPAPHISELQDLPTDLAALVLVRAVMFGSSG